MTRVGCINYAHRRGLGYLMRDFHRNGIVTDVCVVKHPGVPSCADEWYPPGTPSVQLRRLDMRVMQDFCAGMDAMVFFETAFDWSLIPFCRSRGIQTYLVPMYECCPVGHEPPDVYLCPSLLDMEYFKKNSRFLPLPTEYPWRLRTTAQHYIHNGGYLGLRGREGTTLLIEAMQYVRSPLKLTSRVQENVDAAHQRMMAHDPRIEYIAGTVPYEELYASGDVVVMPQKFNGCSLPMQEACASGMVVMASDRVPANSWLNRDPLIPVNGYNRNVRIGGGYLPFDEAIITPQDIAATMDQWFNQDVSALSLAGKEWAERHSWAALGEQWKRAVQP
jgi:glycosyltransferase involved in cell wall biosynthesis